MNKLRILHLEDNGMTRPLVELALKKGGVDVDVAVAKNGPEFLTAWRRMSRRGYFPTAECRDSAAGRAGHPAGRFPSVPFIFVLQFRGRPGGGGEIKAGASDHIQRINFGD